MNEEMKKLDIEMVNDFKESLNNHFNNVYRIRCIDFMGTKRSIKIKKANKKLIKLFYKCKKQGIRVIEIYDFIYKIIKDFDIFKDMENNIIMGIEIKFIY